MPHRPLVVRLAAALALAVLPLAAACDGASTGPLDPGDRFSLVRVDDEPLPWVQASEHGVTHTLLAHTIEFRPDGRAARRVVRRTTAAGAPPVDESFAWTQRYLVDGTSVRLLVECPPNANCVPDEVGTIVDGTLVLRHDGAPPAYAPAYVYERVAED